MHETSKATIRRAYDGRYQKYFSGNGIDVGCGDDSLRRYAPLFPLMGGVKDWDLAQGDAQELPGVAAEAFDWLHSSHCLEHLRDPFTALIRWCQVVRPGGHLVVIIPDEDLYEQGVWPSRFNGDHKHTFTLAKAKSWSAVSVNVLDLLLVVRYLAVPVRIERLEATWLPDQPGIDQTLGPVAECAIEFVLRRV